MSETTTRLPANTAAADAAVASAAESARKATEEARVAREHADRVKVIAAREASARVVADKIEAEAPHWQIIHRSDNGVTERMILSGGYLLRSSWKHAAGVGNLPLTGSDMVFVSGAAPDLIKKGTPIVVRAHDLPHSINTETVTFEGLKDVDPAIIGLADASEVLLRRFDGSIRVVKEAPAPVVGPNQQQVAADALAKDRATDAERARDAMTPRSPQPQPPAPPRG